MVEFLDGGELEQAFERELDAADEVHVAVAWATASNPVHDALLDAAGKVKALVVGLHFHQTDPAFIDAWRGLKKTPLMLVKDTAGVFHPKIYLFRSGKDGVAIVGSANFTKAAFEANTEALLRVTGAWDGEPFVGLRALVEAKRELVKPTDEWLERYTLAWRRRQSARRVLSTPDSDLPAESVSYKLAVDFAAYADLIKHAGRDRAVLAARGHHYTNWLDVLDAISGLRGWPSVGKLAEEDWDRVLGLVQFPGGDRSVDYRTFGWVRWKPKMMLLGSSRARQAIERIPARGPVSAAAWRRFVDDYTDAFKPSALTTASRLLALRRPDRFLSANGRSLNQLEEAVGLKARNLDEYWDLHQAIWSWPWARASRPGGKKAGRIWDARVALLDVLFYDPA